MTRGTWALLIGSLLSVPAALRWLRDDLSAADLLLRSCLATALALGAVHLLVAVVSSYRPEPVEPEPFEERRSSDDVAAAPGS